jgi:hypothetical protein
VKERKKKGKDDFFLFLLILKDAVSLSPEGLKVNYTKFLIGY